MGAMALVSHGRVTVRVGVRYPNPNPNLAQDCCDSGPDCSHLLAMAMDTRAMAPMGTSQ